MTGTDISGFADPSVYHDHTYYGKGCDEPYGASGSGGSTTSCSVQLVETNDAEEQKIGAYYNYQASTIGSGGSYPAGIAIVPDSFCPLGWQLPYGGTGGDYYDKSKSIIYFLNAYNIEYVEHPSNLASLFSYPLSFIESGMYHWYYGKLYNAGRYGFIWTNTNGRTIGNASRFSFTLTENFLQLVDVGKEGGISLRCVQKLASGCNYLVYAL